MYEGLRLTELHEEWAWNTEKARREAGITEKIVRGFLAEGYDAEIRARVAAQGGVKIEESDFGPVYELPVGDADVILVCDVTAGGYRPWPYVLLPHQLYTEKVTGPVVVFPLRSAERVEIEPAVKLRHGIPDVDRIYPRKAAPLRSWVNHATHVIPVEGCHLCREVQR